MPRKNSDIGGVEIKDMSEADLLLLSTVDQDIIVNRRAHWLHLHERNADIEIFAMASYIFTRVISQLVMAIGDSRDLHKQSVYNICFLLDCSKPTF